MASVSIAVSRQQTRPDPGHLLNRGRQIGAAGEHLVHLGAQSLAGRYSLRHGRGLLLVTWRSREEPTSVLIYTGVGTRPTQRHRCPCLSICDHRSFVRMTSDSLTALATIGSDPMVKAEANSAESGIRTRSSSVVVATATYTAARTQTATKQRGVGGDLCEGLSAVGAAAPGGRPAPVTRPIGRRLRGYRRGQRVVLRGAGPQKGNTLTTASAAPDVFRPP